jgi:hypothetical protein
MRQTLEQQMKDFHQFLERQEQSRGWRHVLHCLIAAVVVFFFTFWMIWLTVKDWPVYPTE